ncbi:MAG: hypothetical protein CM1200mP2_12700 [Planctomycetaceae bacterium]|nr:MAG: hypothetical protein CM1200mP2_12700 [Planctomycetaceae bacterium]
MSLTAGGQDSRRRSDTDAKLPSSVTLARKPRAKVIDGYRAMARLAHQHGRSTAGRLRHDAVRGTQKVLIGEGVSTTAGASPRWPGSNEMSWPTWPPATSTSGQASDIDLRHDTPVLVSRVAAPGHDGPGTTPAGRLGIRFLSVLTRVAAETDRAEWACNRASRTTRFSGLDNGPDSIRGHEHARSPTAFPRRVPMSCRLGRMPAGCSLWLVHRRTNTDRSPAAGPGERRCPSGPGPC